MNYASDSSISFDTECRCNYCTRAVERRLEAMLTRIKEENKDKAYDCLMGISGGLDSSYLAYLGHKWGLRILAVHIDDGFDTEISKSNIAKLCKAANIELRVIKPDPGQYYDLTLAYLKAGVPNLAIPQDNILFAFLCDTVKKEGLRYFLSGDNFALESILQRGHVFDSMDMVNLRAIHRKFGTKGINKLKFISSYKKYLRIKAGTVITLCPLNYVEYNRDRAFKELYDFCGFEYYGGKHLENMLTAFVQLRWMPEKFGVDKRSSHLASMIVSGQMSREEALGELEKPLYDPALMSRYEAYISEKLGLAEGELEALLKAPAHEHQEYSFDRVSPLIRKILH